MATKSKKKTAAPAKEPTQNPATVHSETYQKALEDYAGALECLRKGDYSSAMERFREIAGAHADEPELADRARTYALVCERRLEPPLEEPESPEDSYQRAVLRANEGDFEEALALASRAIEAVPVSAKYLYVRASVYALQGLAEPAVADLRKAVEIEPQIRFHAVNDPDFERIRDDAGFIDVIEPTPAGA